MIKKMGGEAPKSSEEKRARKAEAQAAAEDAGELSKKKTAAAPEKEKAGDTSGETSASGEADASDQAQKKEDKSSKADKKPSEAEILKLYLQQYSAEIERLRTDLEKSDKEQEKFREAAEQYQEKLSGVVAEYENYRRRTASEKDSLYAEAVLKAVSALLPALDSLERASAFAESNPVSFRQGVEMTQRQLLEGFKSLGVSEIPAKGETFDPEKHNAVMHVEDESLGEQVVTEVLQKGYAIGDKVIRHSMVKVAN